SHGHADDEQLHWRARRHKLHGSCGGIAPARVHVSRSADCQGHGRTSLSGVGRHPSISGLLSDAYACCAVPATI
ncbi:hypothetical protein EV175_007294, partial [Coemansia sp. RSA 1933]